MQFIVLKMKMSSIQIVSRVYFNKNEALKIYKDGDWTFGKALFKEFDITSGLRIEMKE